MLGREELEELSTIVEGVNTGLVDCESTEVWPDNGTKLFYKEEADKVMDAMEARINELEEANKLAVVVGNQQAGRIKELESKLYGNNGDTTRLLNRINNFFTEDVKAKNIIEDCYKCIHQLLATISKMETTQKWISVKDRLPYSMERSGF